MRYQTRGLSFGGFSLTPWVKRLLIANVAAHAAFWVLGRAFGFPFVVEWFAFTASEVVIKPWTIVTYMFLHADIWHLAINMLVLFFFGPPLESRWGSREFVRFYVICGLGGVALSFLFISSPVLGASAAVYGVMLAFAMAWPDSPIYVWGIFPIKAKWLVGFLFVVTLWSSLSGAQDGVAHLAHLGGLLAALLYLKSDWRDSRALEGIREAARRRVRHLTVVPRDEEEEEAASRRGSSTPPSGGWSAANEDQLLDAVDRVLDKISAEGMGSLTPHEKRLLDEMSRRRRTN